MTELQRLKHRIEQLEADKLRVEAKLEDVVEENTKLRETIAEKELELKLFLERVYGRKSERFIEDPNQLKIDFGESDQVDDAIEGIHQAKMEQEIDVPAHKRRKRKPRNEKLPSHLRREVVTVDLPDDEKAGLTCIGYDVTETLVCSPSKLHIVETRYPKYVDPANNQAGVKQAERNPGLVEGNRYDTSVAAQIITAKYGYHLPVYRQQDIFAGSGWSPARSTLLNIQTAAATLLPPLMDFFANAVRRDTVIGTDDTGVSLLLPKTIPQVDPLDPKSARVREVIEEAMEKNASQVKAKMWAYRGVAVPLNVFDFTVSRHRDGPDLFLVDNDYEGVLLGDCYGANVGIEMRSSGLIVHAACVSHARRKVRDARHTHPLHAKRVLSMFGELYDIETRGRERDIAGRLALRQEEAVPIWDRIRDYITTETKNVLPKEDMAKAIGYLRNQWDGLTRYLSNGSIPIDNNETEQLMKQIALGRKNWLFIGSVAAGYRAANLMTLVSSAVRNDIDVWAYITHVLDALLSGSTDYEALLPHHWATAHPEHIRHYRIQERQQRAERKSQSRAQRRTQRAR